MGSRSRQDHAEPTAGVDALGDGNVCLSLKPLSMSSYSLHLTQIGRWQCAGLEKDTGKSQTKLPATGKSLELGPGPNIVNYSATPLFCPWALPASISLSTIRHVEEVGFRREAKKEARPQCEGVSDTEERREVGCDGHVT